MLTLIAAHPQPTLRVLTAELRERVASVNRITRQLRRGGCRVIRIDWAPKRPQLHVASDTRIAASLMPFAHGLVTEGQPDGSVVCRAYVDPCEVVWVTPNEHAPATL